MFKIGDQVHIKPEWCDHPKEEAYIFTVVNVNEVTERCYIEIVLEGMSLPVNTLVSFDMIEKIGK
jgi:hypothetical protein